MSTGVIGCLYAAATLFVMLVGVPFAFDLGCGALQSMTIFIPPASLDTVTQNV